MRTHFYSFIIVSLIALSGCGGGSDRREIHPVSGTVTMSGSPVADADVVFQPTDTTEGIPARGRTDASGNYTLTTFNTGDGAAAGAYKILISKSADPEDNLDIDLDDPGEAYGEMMGDETGEEGEPNSSLPPKYASIATTPEERTVQAGSNEFSFDLQN